MRIPTRSLGGTSLDHGDLRGQTVVFACSRSPFPEGTKGVIRVPCIGRVGVEHMLECVARGADGVHDDVPRSGHVSVRTGRTSGRDPHAASPRSSAAVGGFGARADPVLNTRRRVSTSPAKAFAAFRSVALAVAARARRTREARKTSPGWTAPSISCAGFASSRSSNRFCRSICSEPPESTDKARRRSTKPRSASRRSTISPISICCCRSSWGSGV